MNVKSEQVMAEDKNWLSGDTQLIKCSFGSHDPLLAQSPHLIFPSGHETREVLSQALPGPLGIWPHGLIVDNKGELISDLDSPEDFVEAFVFWSHPGNQEILWEYLGLKDSVPFSIFIEAGTHHSVLLDMYNALDQMNWDTLQYDVLMGLLANWLDRIGWVVVPLEPEGEYTLLATSSGAMGLLLKVKKMLRAAGIRNGALKRKKGFYEWPSIGGGHFSGC